MTLEEVMELAAREQSCATSGIGRRHDQTAKI